MVETSYAATIKRIFAMSADGMGSFKRMVSGILNDDGVPSYGGKDNGPAQRWSDLSIPRMTNPAALDLRPGDVIAEDPLSPSSC